MTAVDPDSMPIVELPGTMSSDDEPEADAEAVDDEEIGQETADNRHTFAVDAEGAPIDSAAGDDEDNDSDDQLDNSDEEDKVMIYFNFYSMNFLTKLLLYRIWIKTSRPLGQAWVFYDVATTVDNAPLSVVGCEINSLAKEKLPQKKLLSFQKSTNLRNSFSLNSRWKQLAIWVTPRLALKSMTTAALERDATAMLCRYQRALCLIL